MSTSARCCSNVSYLPLLERRLEAKIVLYMAEVSVISSSAFPYAPRYAEDMSTLEMLAKIMMS